MGGLQYTIKMLFSIHSKKKILIESEKKNIILGIVCVRKCYTDKSFGLGI